MHRGFKYCKTTGQNAKQCHSSIDFADTATVPRQRIICIIPQKILGGEKWAHLWSSESYRGEKLYGQRFSVGSRVRKCLYQFPVGMGAVHVYLSVQYVRFLWRKSAKYQSYWKYKNTKSAALLQLFWNVCWKFTCYVCYVINGHSMDVPVKQLSSCPRARLNVVKPHGWVFSEKTPVCGIKIELRFE